MKKKLIILFVVVLLSLPMAAGAELENSDEVIASPGSGGGILVSGKGSVSLEPDIGYVNFSIVESGDDVVEIYRENVATVDDVVDALVEYGLDRENIKTESFDIRDDYRYLPPEEREKEPRLVVNTNLKVLVEDLDEEMGEVLDIGIESGANRVSSISFDVEDPEEHYYDALEEALDNARKKGERIADFYQRSLGEVKEVREDPGRMALGRGGLEMEFGAREALDAQEAALEETLPVEPEEITFESRVEVKYTLN